MYKRDISEQPLFEPLPRLGDKFSLRTFKKTRHRVAECPELPQGQNRHGLLTSIVTHPDPSHPKVTVSVPW
jgi:hypothetical protein